MRTLALLLLLINIAFFAWQQQLLTWMPWQPEQFFPAPVAPPRHNTLPQLVLLSEREAATRVHAAVPTEVAPIAPVVVAEPKASEPKTSSGQMIVVTPPPVPQPPQPIVPIFTPVASPAPPVSPSAETSPPNTPPMSGMVASEDVVATPPTATEQETAATIAAEPSFKSLAMALIGEGKIAPQQISAADETAVTTEVHETVAVAPDNNAPVPPQVTPTVPTHSDKSSDAATAKMPQPSTTTDHSKTIPDKKSLPSHTATDSAKTLLSVPATTTNKTEVVCYRIGSFSQLDSVNSAANWFKQRRATSLTQKGDTRLATTTWIYLPPARSLQQAQATQQQLQRLGIKDTVIINNAGVNTVSLGVYRDQPSVARRLKELQAKGLGNVKTQERYATETKYWLSVKIATNAKSLLSQFQKTFKGLQATTTACNILF